MDDNPRKTLRKRRGTSAGLTELYFILSLVWILFLFKILEDVFPLMELRVEVY